MQCFFWEVETKLASDDANVCRGLESMRAEFRPASRNDRAFHQAGRRGDHREFGSEDILHGAVSRPLQTLVKAVAR